MRIFPIQKIGLLLVAIVFLAAVPLFSDRSWAIDGGSCANIAGDWTGKVTDGFDTFRIIAHLTQDVCSVTGTIESPDSCPGQCDMITGPISATVSGNSVSANSYDPWVDCDTCSIICYAPTSATLTVDGNTMTGSGQSTDCIEGGSFSVQFALSRDCPIPGTPSNPSPANGATGISTSTSLAWSATANTDSYDVYFGTTSNPASVGNRTTASYSPGVLSYGTTYYWKVVANNNCGNSTSGALWLFTTGPAPCATPGAPSGPTPSDDATGVSTSPTLIWANSINTTSYEVYFGTSPNPPVSGGTTNTTFPLSSLNYSTTYYWKIVAKNSCGNSTQGPIWSFTTGPQPGPSPGLCIYDDFSGPKIDKGKWKRGEFVREIDTVNQKLMLKQTSPNPIGITSTFPYVTLTSLKFADLNSVYSIKADVSVVESVMLGLGNTAARLEGLFFNDGTSGTGYAVDIYAEIALIWDASGLRGFWWVGRYTGEGSSSLTPLGGAYFSPILVTGTTYTLYLVYDISANQFTLEIVGVAKKTFGSLNGLPARASNAKMPTMGLGTWVQINNETSSGYISATFDNVIAKDEAGNVTLNEDFSSSPIDKNKWMSYELVREISGGKLRSEVRGGSATEYSIYNPLDFASPSSINRVQAKITPLTYQNPSAGIADAGARIMGRYYHDGTPGEGLTGDVAAQIVIGGKGTNPSAYWAVFRFNDETGINTTGLASGTFTTPISLGITYSLFLGWNGSDFTFKVDNEVAGYTPTGTVGPPNKPWKEIGTRVFAPNGGGETVVEALFEDVMVNCDQGNGDLKGDVNGDGFVNLIDAILALQIMAGIEPASSISKEADVNADGKIGLEELIYVMHETSGLR